MPERGTVIRVLPGNRAVVMSSRCEFKEIRVGPGVKPGDEVVYSESDVCGRRPLLRAAAMVASFLLVCLLAWSLMEHVASAKVYARVAFQINPALEISVDRGLRVSSASAFDGEGEALLQNVRLKGMLLDDAVSEIVRFSVRRGYLEKGGENYIAVSFCFPGSGDDGELLQRLGARLEGELQGQGVEAYIYYLQGDKRVWQQALKKRVSPISYMLWRQAKGDGKPHEMVSAVSLKDPGMKEIASRLAVRIGHASRKQGDAGGASGATQGRGGEKTALPGGKGVRQQMMPSGLPEAQRRRAAGPPAGESGSLRQKRAVPEEGAVAPKTRPSSEDQ